MHLGDSLQAENLTLDEGLSLVTNLDATIASVTHAVIEVEPEVEEDDELGEGEEGTEGAEGEASSEDKAEDSTDKTGDSDSGDSQ